MNNIPPISPPRLNSEEVSGRIALVKTVGLKTYLIPPQNTVCWFHPADVQKELPLLFPALHSGLIKVVGNSSGKRDAEHLCLNMAMCFFARCY